MSRFYIKLGVALLLVILLVVLGLTLSAAARLRQDIPLLLNRGRVNAKIYGQEIPGNIGLSILIHTVYLVAGLGFIVALSFAVLRITGVLHGAGSWR